MQYRIDGSDSHTNSEDALVKRGDERRVCGAVFRPRSLSMARLEIRTSEGGDVAGDYGKQWLFA